MNPKAYITTSWDDGHTLDFRIAEMLGKYGLRGTFYIPRHASTGVMTEANVRELSARFEIGAHTMHHVFLDSADDRVASREIRDSKIWVEEMTGKPCAMFCPPGGKFDDTHIEHVRTAGFEALRSVELLSLDLPRKHGGLLIMPTTLQAHPHGFTTYAKNAAKRHAWRNLWHYVLHGRTAHWDRLSHTLFDMVRTRGGVFHLWGHSWELEQTAQWERLDEVFAFLGDVSKEIPCLTNSEVCRLAA
jgi:peptidoglycan/xylan/chitin deacetylase (PgdA/CDA1 family)